MVNSYCPQTGRIKISYTVTDLFLSDFQMDILADLDIENEFLRHDSVQTLTDRQTDIRVNRRQGKIDTNFHLCERGQD